MTLELGLHLAHAHLVTRWQLENALQAQLIYRGPVLANLIKLGYLPEEEAIRFCSRIYNIPIIKENLLRRIPERTLRMIPRDFVFQWRLLPVGMRDGTLMLASHLPIGAELLAELAFLTGTRTRAVLCSERLLIQAVRYYYTLSLPSWTVDTRVIGQFEEPEPLDSADATTPPVLEPPLTETIPPEEPRRRVSLHDTLIPADDEGFHPDESGDPDDPMREHVAAALDLVRSTFGERDEPPAQETPPEAPTDRPDERSPDHAGETPEATGELPELLDLPQPERSAPPVGLDLEAFEDRMALAEDRDEIIQAACGWLAQSASPVLFLNAKQDVLSGFHAEGIPDTTDLRAIALPADSPQALAEAAQSGECVIRELSGDEGLTALAEALGVGELRWALVMPVHLRGRMVGVIVAFSDRDQAPLSADTEQLRRIRRIVSDSFETLILSRKIGV